MLMHNHASGDPTPSQADIQMTKVIIDIAAPLGIPVHDHIIVGKNGHASLKGMRLIGYAPHNPVPDAVQRSLRCSAAPDRHKRRVRYPDQPGTLLSPKSGPSGKRDKPSLRAPVLITDPTGRR
jgi:hypothetical protein